MIGPLLVFRKGKLGPTGRVVPWRACCLRLLTPHIRVGKWIVFTNDIAAGFHPIVVGARKDRPRICERQRIGDIRRAQIRAASYRISFRAAVRPAD